MTFVRHFIGVFFVEKDCFYLMMNHQFIEKVMESDYFIIILLLITCNWVLIAHHKCSKR